MVGGENRVNSLVGGGRVERSNSGGQEAEERNPTPRSEEKDSIPWSEERKAPKSEEWGNSSVGGENKVHGVNSPVGGEKTKSQLLSRRRAQLKAFFANAGTQNLTGIVQEPHSHRYSLSSRCR